MKFVCEEMKLQTMKCNNKILNEVFSLFFNSRKMNGTRVGQLSLQTK